VAWEVRTDARLAKHDKQIEASRRLVETGMKMLTRLVVNVREMKKTMRLLVEARADGNGRRKNLPFYSSRSRSTESPLYSPTVLRSFVVLV